MVVVSPTVMVFPVVALFSGLLIFVVVGGGEQRKCVRISTSSVA